MSQPVSQPSQKIFISYRRDDSAGHAGRLFDNLSAHFGKDQIFMDIDRIEPGEDFVQVIETAVGACDVLVALIGRHWLTITDGTARRLDNPNDFVRLEIAAALDRDVRVIPVLVQGATMPEARDLPDELMKLSRRNAFELSDRRWPRDVEQLITALERFFAGQQGAQRREAEAQRAREAEELKRFADLRAAINTRVHELEAEEVERQRSVERTSASSKEMPPTARLAMLPPSVEAVAHSDAQPSNVTNRVEIELVWISPGSFMMGSDKYDDEKPMHRVTISEGFYMGKYEVTQAQWQAVMGNDPSHFRGDDLPVENVSWNDTQEFINKLNAQSDGYTYRLPTEAEWEYAARAGTTGNYAGDLDAMAWYEKNSGSKTHPVGSKQPNGFGLYDMHGNVWEWVQDWYHEAYAGAPTDGSAWLSGGEQKYRVLRGGSWNSYAYNLRSANRGRLAPDYRFSLLGFRVVAVARA